MNINFVNFAPFRQPYLPNSRIWLVEIDIQSRGGLDFRI